MSTKIPIDGCGLSVTCGRDGTWLHFSTESGRCASLNVDAMNKGDIVGGALRDWCADRQKQAERILKDLT